MFEAFLRITVCSAFAAVAYFKMRNSLIASACGLVLWCLTFGVEHLRCRSLIRSRLRSQGYGVLSITAQAGVFGNPERMRLSSERYYDVVAQRSTGQQCEFICRVYGIFLFLFAAGVEFDPFDLAGT